MTLSAAIQAVTSKIRPIQGTPKFDRLSLFIKSKTGGINLAAYIGDTTIPEATRVELVTSVIDVIDGEKWDELPSPPAGQAERAPATVAAAPKPVAIIATPPSPPPAPAAPAPVATPPVVGLDPMTAAIVAGVLPHVLAAMPKQVAEPSALSTDAIRAVVRAELAHLFAAIAKGIEIKEGA
jgi:hypothetical protein